MLPTRCYRSARLMSYNCSGNTRLWTTAVSYSVASQSSGSGVSGPRYFPTQPVLFVFLFPSMIIIMHVNVLWSIILHSHTDKELTKLSVQSPLVRYTVKIMCGFHAKRVTIVAYSVDQFFCHNSHAFAWKPHIVFYSVADQGDREADDITTGWKVRVPDQILDTCIIGLLKRLGHN